MSEDYDRGWRDALAKLARLPTKEEKRQLTNLLMNARGTSHEETRDAVEAAYIGVFDQYVTGGPGYMGKAMFVVWDGSPSFFDVFTWNEVGSIEQETSEELGQANAEIGRLRKDIERLKEEIPNVDELVRLQEELANAGISLENAVELVGKIVSREAVILRLEKEVKSGEEGG